MTFPDAVRSVLSQYAGFRGRAPRSEYWWWYLFTVLVNVVTTGIDRVTDAAVGVSFVGAVVSLGLVIPTLAVSVRRLHDSGLSGWWLLAPLSAALVGTGLVIGGGISFVAGVFVGDAARQTVGLGIALLALGAVLLLTALVVGLVLMLRPSTPGPNRFGPGPGPAFPYPPTGGSGYGYGYGPGYAPGPWPPAGPPAGGAAAPPAPGPEGNVTDPA